MPLIIDTAFETSSAPSSESWSGSSNTTPPSPSSSRPTYARKRTQSRPFTRGIDPSVLNGCIITRIVRSRTHPAVSLYTLDGRSFQVRVDGYDPVHAGLPREIECNAALAPLFGPSAPSTPISATTPTTGSSPTHSRSKSGGWKGIDQSQGVRLTVQAARYISMKDAALSRDAVGQELRWNVEHLALAFKFAEKDGWHCCWASMAERDASSGQTAYRTFDDVYVEENSQHFVQTSHRKT
ncbi:unnamed protein product [Peniophora sp. CBMAI 1063]|nr:unnamed protein product [Peniophora sp. CBMAI 1063]